MSSKKLENDESGARALRRIRTAVYKRGGSIDGVGYLRHAGSRAQEAALKASQSEQDFGA